MGMLVGFFRGKASSTLAGTDALIQGVGDAVLWTEENDKNGHRASIEIIRSLTFLADPNTQPAGQNVQDGINPVGQVLEDGRIEKLEIQAHNTMCCTSRA